MAAAAAWTHTCEEFIRRSLLEGVPRLCSTTSFSLHLCWQTQEEPMMMVSARSKRLSKRDDQEAKRTLFQLEGRVNARNWLSEPMRWEEERAAERQTDGLWGPTSSCSKLFKLTPWLHLSPYFNTSVKNLRTFFYYVVNDTYCFQQVTFQLCFFSWLQPLEIWFKWHWQKEQADSASLSGWSRDRELKRRQMFNPLQKEH